MKKIPLLSSILVLGLFSIKAQVGVNTNTPKANLDIIKSSDAAQPDGVLVPRVSIQDLNDKAGTYLAPQNGTLVFVSDLTTGTASGKTIDIKAEGFYYYKHDTVTPKWVAVGGGASGFVPVGENISTESNWWTTASPDSNYFTVTSGAASSKVKLPPANYERVAGEKFFKGKTIYIRNMTNGTIVVENTLPEFANFNYFLNGLTISAYSDGNKWYVLNSRVH